MSMATAPDLSGTPTSSLVPLSTNTLLRIGKGYKEELV